MITRKKYYSKRLPTKDARKLYLFCEGVSTEPDYFTFFKGLSSNLEIITLPPESGTDPLKLMELAKSKLLEEDSRYIMDYIANDSYHFYKDAPKPEEIEEHPTFKAFVNSAITGGFDFQIDPVKVETAVENAKINFKRDEEGKLELFSTEVYELAEVIIPFVRQHLDRL